MGKASKWLRGLFGLKKPDPSSSAGAKPKKKWGFVKSYREKDQPTNIPATISDEEAEDPSRHAIKLAAATAVVAEAAVAAAQAVAEVVRLTSSGRAISGNSNSTPSPSANNRVFRFGNARSCSVSPASVNGGEYGLREEAAAVIIQSYFRGYLSRRALRALRALVRLQAIVRGRIWRKKYANELNHWKELLRTHNLVNAGHVAIFESPHKGPATPEKFERMKNGENLMYKRNGSQNKFRTSASRSKECTSGIDHYHYHHHHQYQNVQPQMMHKPRNLFHSSHLSIGNSEQYSQGFEVQSSTSPFKFSYYVEDDPFWTAESSPQKRGPMTPTRSDGSRSCLSGYSDCPNYMTCTESSKAKTRSLSAPRQRPAAAQQYERSSSTTARRLSIIHGYGQRVYPGSGRLDRTGMPVMAIREEGGVGFSGGLWHRF